MRIAAVVVTHNRPAMLRKCLDAIGEQSRQSDGIVVVDNASAEETRIFLRTLQRADSRVDVVTLPFNTGASGGFHAGIKRALELDMDAIWVMDDDAYPDPDCLARLEATLIPSRTECVCPLIVGTDGTPQLYHHKLHSKWMNESPVTLVDGKDCYEISANAFVGPLFTADVVRQAGLPREHFFIWFDDTEFTLRISDHTSIVLNTAAVIRHQVYAPRNAGAIDWKELYGIRNKYWTIIRMRDPMLYLYWTFRTLRSYLRYIVKTNDSLGNRLAFSWLYVRLVIDAHRTNMNPDLIRPSSHTLALRR